MKRNYNYEGLAKQLAREVVQNNYRLIGITGTSCIGKSSLTRLLKKSLRQGEMGNFSVQVIGADSYLKEEYRDGIRFWNGSSAFLTPEHFDWSMLNRDIQTLQQGDTVERSCYIRGIGWNNVQTLYPADFLIVEGLFLDAVQAVEEWKHDLLLTLSGSDDLIRKLRMDRDDYYRQNFKDFKRTKQGTVEETEQTLLAGKSYEKCITCENVLHLWVREGFEVSITGGTYDDFLHML